MNSTMQLAAPQSVQQHAHISSQNMIILEYVEACGLSAAELHHLADFPHLKLWEIILKYLTIKSTPKTYIYKCHILMEYLHFRPISTIHLLING
jgi:hypothetical protein